MPAVSSDNANDWRSRARPASYMGVRFWVEASEAEVGRRTVTHVFPGADRPSQVYSEDIGLRVNRFRIDGFVVGKNYDQARDQLIAALETPGPGTLIHPWWGQKTVALDGPVSVRESDKDGGRADFSIPFVVASGEISSVVSTPDTAAQVTSAAKVAAGAVQQSFSGTSQLTSLLGKLTGLLAFLGKVRSGIATALNVVDNVDTDITQLGNDLSALIDTPELLFNALLNTLLQISSLVPVGAGTADAATVALVTGSSAPSPASSAASAGAVLTPGAPSPTIPAPTGLASPLPTSSPAGGDPTPDPQVVTQLLRFVSDAGDYQVTPPDYGPSPTPIQQAQIAAATALQFAVQASAAVCACIAATQIDYASSNDAANVQSALTDLIEQLQQAAPDDDSYSALADLEVAIAQHLTAQAGALPSVVEYTPQRTVAGLVIAHQLYGDARRESEILTRNGIANPCFVPGLMALEVLSE